MAPSEGGKKSPPQWVTSWPEWHGIPGNVTVVPLSDYEQLERDLSEYRHRAESAEIAQVEAARSAIVPPDGWVMVPVEPTHQMEKAYKDAMSVYIKHAPESAKTGRWKKDKRGYKIPQREKCYARWSAMLAVVPDQAARVPVESPNPHSITETDTKLLHAYTATNYSGDYPDLFNLTMVRMGGGVVLTVRLPTVFGAPPGATASVRFTHDMWREFVKAVPEANRVFVATDFLDGMM